MLKILIEFKRKQVQGFWKKTKIHDEKSKNLSRNTRRHRPRFNNSQEKLPQEIIPKTVIIKEVRKIDLIVSRMQMI